MDKPEDKIAIVGPVEIPKEKMAMVSIIMSFKDFTNPVSMQSISDAALQRKKELEVGTDGLKFVCPKCKGTRLECCENGPYNSEVLNIDKEGDFDFSDVNASGDVERFQCLDCGFVLQLKEDGFPEYTITEHEEVVKWIKLFCKQEK